VLPSEKLLSAAEAGLATSGLPSAAVYASAAARDLHLASLAADGGGGGGDDEDVQNELAELVEELPEV